MNPGPRPILTGMRDTLVPYGAVNTMKIHDNTEIQTNFNCGSLASKTSIH